MNKNIIIFMVVFSLIIILSFVSYKLVVHKKITSTNSKSYGWKATDTASTCSSINCKDTGSQSRRVKCFDNDGGFVSDSLCVGVKPMVQKPCINTSINGQQCPKWVANNQPCPSACGGGSLVLDGYICSANVKTDCNSDPYNQTTNLAGKPAGTVVCPPSLPCTPIIKDLGRVTDSSPLGANATYGYLKISSTTITLAKNSVNGCFLLCVVWYGTISVYINMPYYVLTNAVLVNGLEFMNNNSRCDVAINIVCFQITDPSQDTTLRINTSSNFGDCALPTNSTATLILTQTSNFIVSSSVPDNTLPKVSYYTFESPSNNYPLNYPRPVVNQFGAIVTHYGPTGVIIIPSSITKPFLLLLVWSTNNSSTYSLPVISTAGLTHYETYFNGINSTISNSGCQYIDDLFYMAIYRITSSGTDGVLSVNQSGNIPHQNGSLYIFELNL